MLALTKTSHGTVAIDRARRLVRITRSATPFEALDELRAFYEGVASTVERLDRGHLTLLVDLRDAPARNDPAFETTVAGYRKRMFTGFSRVAVLVKSATGKLNVSRHARDDGLDITIFQDEAAALSWLDGTTPSPSSRRRS